MAGVQLVALYKALGGGWEHYRAVPPIRTPEPAIAAAARESSGLRPISTDPGLTQVQPYTLIEGCHSASKNCTPKYAHAASADEIKRDRRENSVRENSYAISDEELEFGIRSLAVAVRSLPPSASVHHLQGFGRPI
jgi:hypothetical protein